MNITAEISCDVVISAADAAISRERKALDALRERWITRHKGTRYGIFWRKVWDDEAIETVWAKDHHCFPDDGDAGNYHVKRILKIMQIRDVAISKHVSQVRLDREGMALLDL